MNHAGIRGWEIARRFTLIGYPTTGSDSWRKFFSVAVLGRDGRLYTMTEAMDVEGKLVKESVSVEPMGPAHYEEWDAHYVTVDEPRGTERYTRASSFDSRYTGRLTEALRQFDNQDHTELRAASLRGNTRRVGTEMWEVAKFAVPTALLAPLVYFVLLGTWSTEYMKPLDWNNPHPQPETAGVDAFVLTFVLVVCMLLCLGGLGLAFPYPTDQEVFSIPAACGVAVGVAAFFYQVFSGSGGMASWFWPPLFAVLGHLAYGLYRQTRTIG
ncbi:hypothetical protein [Nocardia altamirensis]|uniref:hypothetical protein n=1 Tax=Nocardia altamirensis TaxID=472158 RepID=UPI0008402C0C|nr:hypothetical protein [Nocardia altamirensis]